MILKNVDNFSVYPDGRIRLDGMSHAPGAIASLMEEFGLHLGGCGEQGFCAINTMGTSISAAGPGVMGYLLDEGGIEAPSSDLEAFLEEVTSGISVVKIEGHYCPDPDTMIQSSLAEWKQFDELVVASKRELLTHDGRRQV
ncbi:unnamed protein product, partial [Laminaria digitata]